MAALIMIALISGGFAVSEIRRLLGLGIHGR
jgi:hypothetical protein